MSTYRITCCNGVETLVEQVNPEQHTLRTPHGVIAGTPEVVNVLYCLMQAAQTCQTPLYIHGMYGTNVVTAQTCLLGFGLGYRTANALQARYNTGPICRIRIAENANALGPVLGRRPYDSTYYLGAGQTLQISPNPEDFGGSTTLTGQPLLIYGWSMFMVMHATSVPWLSNTSNTEVTIYPNRVRYRTDNSCLLEVETQYAAVSLPSQLVCIEGIISSITLTQTGSARVLLVSNDTQMHYRAHFRYLNYDNSLAVGDVIVAILRPSRTHPATFVLQDLRRVFQTPRKEPKVTPSAVMLLEDLVEDLETNLTITEIKQRLLHILVVEDQRTSGELTASAEVEVEF